MISLFTRRLFRLLIALLICHASYAQNSVLINFGSTSCTSATPSFSLIQLPLTFPTFITSCDMSAQLPDYFSVFVAYNPRNNKIYIADIRTGETKIWLLDMGLPVNIECPHIIPVEPDYTYGYVSNNFEFDNNGDLWSLSNYDPVSGQCNIDKFDVNTGAIINTRILQFPVGEFPTTIASGDVTILPNGRMFACLGSGICRLYEITNYNSATPASASYLQTMPKDCYGIAYLNGRLELSGIDFVSSCYYYDYDIAANTLSAEQPFQNGQLPIDNSSVTPSVGCTKRLLGATQINSNTADLVYEVHLENLGNVVLNNVNLVDDLGLAFGASNISNVSVNFVAGSNAAGLILNPAYNGTTDINILNPGQDLPNNVSTNHDYFFKAQIHFRVTNLNSATTYLNLAQANAEIGGANPLTLVNVSDFSNNGDSTVVDPNSNGNAGDLGENTPTPFSLGLLPVKFLTINAHWLGKETSLVNWQVATPTLNAAKFEVQFSLDRRNWQTAGSVMIENDNRSNYDFTHLNVPDGDIYYRVKQTDNDETFTFSRIVLLRSRTNGKAYLIYPNPANEILTISGVSGQAELTFFDATGRRLLQKIINSSPENINTAIYPTGTYFLHILTEGNLQNYKVVIKH